MHIRFKPGVKPLCAIPLMLAATLLAACGSSSSTPPATTSAVDQNTGARSRAHVDARTRPDPVTNAVVTHRPLHGTGGSEINDDNPGSADAPHGSGKTDVRPAAGRTNPCTLVSRAQAQAIVGEPIASMQEAPLGPTCIYQPAGSKSFVTLAIEPINLPKVLAHVRGYSEAHIKGHTADCGVYGQPTTFVALPRAGVLTITGPCAIGAKFAATALPRLGA